MSALRRSLGDYLAMRRALGYALEGTGRLLENFVSFAEAAGTATITIECALAWATLPTNASPGWWARRLGMVRGFAHHVQAFEPATEVPPVDLLRGRNRRPTPYLYSDRDVTALLVAARTLSPLLKAATIETLIGLLAATGLRIGEARHLDHDDIDWRNRLLIVRDGKFAHSRLVPLHATTTEALRAYTSVRDRLCPRPSAPSLFVSPRGNRLAYSSVYPSFRQLLQETGLDEHPSRRRPRLHDFRHSFAVKTQMRGVASDATHRRVGERGLALM